MKKFALVFLVLTIVIAVNMPQGLLAEFGISANILMAALVAFVIAGLVSSQGFGLIVLVILAAAAANVPPEMASSIGYDRHVMIAILGALIILPFIARHF